MTDEVRAQLLEELDVSVRLAGFLSELGLTTVGDLLDLPTIEIPATWPPKIARLSVAELRGVLEDLGVEYTGEIIAPPLKPAELTATGDVAARWATISAWLAEHHPRALALFAPPASPEAIAAAEAALGVTLPEDYKQFLRIHNGQNEFAPWVGLGALLPIEEVAAARANIFNEDGAIDPDQVGPGIRAVDYLQAWIPISRSSRNRDYLCLDLDPAPGGTVGQILEFVVDFDARPLVAGSFADLLAKYFEQAQTGEIDLSQGLDDD